MIATSEERNGSIIGEIIQDCVAINQTNMLNGCKCYRITEKNAAMCPANVAVGLQ